MFFRTSAVSFTKFSAPCVAKFGNSLRMTYHQFFSPYGRKNWVRASSKVSYAVLLSKFGAVFGTALVVYHNFAVLVNYYFFLLITIFWDRNVSLTQAILPVNWQFFLSFNVLPFTTALLVYHNYGLMSTNFYLFFLFLFIWFSIKKNRPQ